jgi:HIP---CoA ligase
MTTNQEGLTLSISQQRSPLELAEAATLPAVLNAYAAAYPEQELVIADDRSQTAEDFAAGCRRFATNLLDRGLRPGDVVGVLIPNGWRWLTVALGAQYAGIICVPLNTFYKESELQGAVRKTGIKLIFADRNFFGRDYQGLLAAAGLLDAAAKTDFQGTVFWESGAASPDGVDLDACDQIEGYRCSPDDTAFYVFTSGSSAEPKVVVLNHKNLILNCFEIGHRQHVAVGDRLWMAAPMFFGYGCANALLVVLTHGLTFCLQERFDALESARFIAEHRCTVYYGLGGMTRSLVAAGAHAKFDLSSLRTGTTGFSEEDVRLAIEVLGVTEVCSLYGLTEGNGHTTMSDAFDALEDKLHTQGTVLPTQELRLVDVATGLEQPRGESSLLGEIQIRGCVTTGYLNDAVANAKAFTADGWFRTGDLGWLDLKGQLHFSGRLKEVLKVNGITISPAEVENVIMGHPDIDQVFAFGWKLPDQDEESLCCAVVLRPGVAPPGDVQTELRNWMRERVSSYKVPSLVLLIPADGIPTTTTGKVSKRLIGERFISNIH